MLHTEWMRLTWGWVLSWLKRALRGKGHSSTWVGNWCPPRKSALSLRKKPWLCWMIEQLKYYLRGRPFTVVTDHVPLQWLARMKDTNSRLMQWYLALQPYCFTGKYKRVMEHANANFLSHQTVWVSLERQAYLEGVCVCEPGHPPSLLPPEPQHQQPSWGKWRKQQGPAPIQASAACQTTPVTETTGKAGSPPQLWSDEALLEQLAMCSGGIPMPRGSSSAKSPFRWCGKGPTKPRKRCLPILWPQALLWEGHKGTTRDERGAEGRGGRRDIGAEGRGIALLAVCGVVLDCSQ